MGLDPDLRKQLVAAREALIDQICEIERRGKAGFRVPDYRDVYAELQSQLREINEMLQQDDGEQA